ncbi:MAG TPA: hypothetical protein VFY44_06490 [Thermoleophilaceae bacterium]|nr:hypothetical protein [Thermoleophilaceae bacterium]
MTGAADVPALLDGWIDDPQVRTHHRRASTADADRVWRAADELRLSDTRTLGRLVRWRIPGTPPTLTFRELLRRYPFISLEEGPNHSLSGLCGRIWTLSRDYPELSGPDAFASWDESGTVRIVFATWVERGADGESVLCNEARIEPVDRRAGLRLRALWAAIGRFEPLIGTEAVSRAVRQAEAGG